MQRPKERVKPYPCIRFQPFPLLKSLFGRMTGNPIENGLGDVPALPAASLLASEAAALGAYVAAITNTST